MIRPDQFFSIIIQSNKSSLIGMTDKSSWSSSQLIDQISMTSVIYDCFVFYYFSALCLHGYCIDMVSAQCVSSHELKVFFGHRKPYHTGYIYMVSPQCVSSHDLQCCASEKKYYHNGCIDMVSLQCVFSHAL